MDTNENTSTEVRTVESWERKFLEEKIDSAAAGLERIAEDIRRKKNSIDRPYFASYVNLVSEIIHEVTWGVANLNLEVMLRGATAADLDRASRAPKKDESE